MTTGIEISSTNYVGQTANITYYPDTGGTVNLGAQIIPYTVQLEYYYGVYELDFSAYGVICYAYISNPDTNFLLQENYSLILQEDGFGILLSGTPTPTPTVTTTQTPTPTNTPTVTQTPTNTTTPTNTPTPSTTPAILVTSGLIIELDANDSLSYSGSGANVYNLRNIGTYTHTLADGTFTTLSGVKCFDLNPSTARVEVQGTGPALPDSGYTYVTWARVKTSSTFFRTLFRTSLDHPALVQIATDNLGFYDNQGGGAFVDSGYDVTPIEDVWVQYAIVGDSNQTTYYINNSQVGSTINVGPSGQTHYQWGGHSNQSFGYVANMYFYNRQLSLSEVQQLYKYLSGRFN